MDESTTSARGRFGLSWSRIGRVGRLAAALALVAVTGAGLFAVSIGVPRGLGIGSGAGTTAGPIPTAPAAPAGWSRTYSFGQAGPDGLWSITNGPEFSPRIAIHVVCNGPDDLIVLASTDAGWTPMDGGPALAATFRCEMGGRESRIEMTAPSDFLIFAAVVIRNPASIVDTSFTVSIEVPDATLTASSSPSPTPAGPVPPSISVSPVPSN